MEYRNRVWSFADALSLGDEEELEERAGERQHQSKLGHTAHKVSGPMNQLRQARKDKKVEETKENADVVAASSDANNEVQPTQT